MEVQSQAAALAHWPGILGKPVLVMQRENTVFRVETTTGPHALRLHRPGYHALAAIRSELDWMAMLAANGIQVPRPAPTHSGALLVSLPDGRLASLLSWLPGAPLGQSGQPLDLGNRDRRAVFRRIGAEMARLHRLSDDWQRPAGFDRPAWDRAGLIGPAPVWGRFWEIPVSGADSVLLRQTRDRLAAALADYDAQGADCGLIHADLVRENILLDGDEVRFIDFDDSGFGYRMFDLATALLKNLDEPDAPALEQALLQGYGAARPLRDHDARMLDSFLVLRSLTYLGWAADRADDQGMAARAERFLRNARQMIATRLPG